MVPIRWTTPSRRTEADRKRKWKRKRKRTPGGGPPAPPERARPSFPGGLGSGWRRRLTLVGVLLVIAIGTIRLLRGSARSVDPGYAGIAVGRVNGSVELLPAGTHFRPPALYDLHVVRISDQLLTGPEGSFSVSTKEGVAANVTIQARWALDRRLPPSQVVGAAGAARARARRPRRRGRLPRARRRATRSRRSISDKREEFAAIAAKQARERLAESGIVLKEVLISDLTLPPDFERGREAMVDELQKTERMDVTLKLKAKEVEQTRLEAEAQKARVVQQAEAAAQQRVIQAKGESDAMKFILEQKHKEIDQKKLEAQADRETRVQRAQSEAEASKISAEARRSAPPHHGRRRGLRDPQDLRGAVRELEARGGARFGEPAPDSEDVRGSHLRQGPGDPHADPRRRDVHGRGRPPRGATRRRRARASGRRGDEDRVRNRAEP